MQKLIDTLKNTIFKFEVSISLCQPDEGTFHLEFEDEKYSQKSLLNLIKRSVMYFALTPQEFKDMSSNEIHEMNPTAWTRISTAHRNSKGDYGELLLYLILIAFYPTERFVTKVRLRSNQKDQIKGFDCAHFTVDEHDNLSFWLGEAKFRNKFSDAVQDAFSSLRDHCNYNFIKSEFRILAPNLEVNKNSPQYDKLMSALRAERSLDNLQFVFPILVTYDSNAVKKSKSIGDDFKRYLEAETKKKYDYIRKNWTVTKPNFRFVFILFPLDTISELKSELEGIENAERDRD